MVELFPGFVQWKKLLRMYHSLAGFLDHGNCYLNALPQYQDDQKQDQKYNRKDNACNSKQIKCRLIHACNFPSLSAVPHPHPPPSPPPSPSPSPLPLPTIATTTYNLLVTSQCSIIRVNNKKNVSRHLK